MSTAIKEMDKVELVNLERLAYILKSLSVAESETLEILLDAEAFRIIDKSLEELEKGDGIQIDEWEFSSSLLFKTYSDSTYLATQK